MSKAEDTVLLLRAAADALDQLPKVMRRPTPLFGGFTPDALRLEADHIRSVIDAVAEAT